MACLGLYIDNRRRKDDWTTYDVHGHLGSCANGRVVFQMMMKTSIMLSYLSVSMGTLRSSGKGLLVPLVPSVWSQPPNALPSSYLILGYSVLRKVLFPCPL